MHTTEQLRFNMIEQQIRVWNVLDPQVLATLDKVSRDRFVPPSFKNFAFHDIEIPLTLGDHVSGEVMLAPRVEARLLQELQLNAIDSVLEVGTGSGYQAALIAQIAREVVTVELNPKLAEFAKINLHKEHISNVTVEVGDAHKGWKSQEFNAILLTGSVPSIPEELKYQLRVGGRLVAVVGKGPMQECIRITRQSASEFSQQIIFDTVIPPLKGPVVNHFRF